MPEGRVELPRACPSPPSSADLSQWSLHGVASQHVKVEMMDRLPRIWAIVGDDPIAAVKEVLLTCNLDRQVEEFDGEIGTGDVEIPQGRDMSFRHDEYVSRGLGLKIPKGHGSRRLGNKCGVQFASRDAAENTILVAFRSRHAFVLSFILWQSMHIDIRSGQVRVCQNCPRSKRSDDPS